MNIKIDSEKIGKISEFCYLGSKIIRDEAWTIDKRERKNVKAFEMWCYGELLKISWTDMMINEEVFILLYIIVKKK